MNDFSRDVSKIIKKSKDLKSFSNKNFESVNVVPTYQQNTDSSRLPFSKVFREEMLLESFLWMLDRLTAISSVREINFVGGEPLKWSFLEEAIFLSRKKNFSTKIYTDAVSRTRKSFSDLIVINLQNFFLFPDLRDQIKENIYFYKQSGVSLQLNFYQKNLDTDREEIARGIAKEFDIRLKIAPAFSHEKLFCSNCPFSGFFIQPDGDTVSFCKFLSAKVKLSEFLSLRDLYENGLLPQVSEQRRCLAA